MKRLRLIIDVERPGSARGAFDVEYTAAYWLLARRGRSEDGGEDASFGYELPTEVQCFATPTQEEPTFARFDALPGEAQARIEAAIRDKVAQLEARYLAGGLQL